MSRRFFLFVILIAIAFELAILNYFRIFNTKPDFLLILMVIASLVFRPGWAIFFSIILGIFKDSFSVNAAGMNTVLFALWSFLIIKLSRKISLDNNYFCAAVIFCAGVFHNIASGIIFAYIGKFIPAGLFLRIIFLESMYTACVSLLVFKLIKPVFN